MACWAKAGADRPEKLVRMILLWNTSGRAERSSPAWQQWIHFRFSPARMESSRSPFRMATSAVLAYWAICSLAPGA